MKKIIAAALAASLVATPVIAAPNYNNNGNHYGQTVRGHDNDRGYNNRDYNNRREVRRAQRASEDRDHAPPMPRRIVALALLEGEPVAQPGARPGEPVLQRVEVGGQGAQQQRDGDLAADHHLFEVEDLGAQARDGAHQRLRDAGAVGSGERR